MNLTRTTRHHTLTISIGALLACASLWSAAPALARAPHNDRAHAPRPLAHTAIVGGARIPITQAPWQVAIIVKVSEEEELLCGGSIVSETEIVTAGHCLFDPNTKIQVPASAITVFAGTASITESEIHGATVQKMSLASVRVHPYYEYALGAGTPDDVGVLTLSSPLEFNAEVQPISLQRVGSSPPEGTPATMTGFGQQNSALPEDEFLYSLGTTLSYRGECSTEADALFLCARTATGSGCFGDSGGGLTTGAPATLIGVTDIVELVHEECSGGALNGFVDVAAPEIRDFIEGRANPLSSEPPRAPRGGFTIKVRAIPQVGHPVTCEAGTWSGAPTFTYAFIDSRNGQVLQSSPSSSYELTAYDVGRTIYCEVQASNAGGTGYQRTTALRGVEVPAQSSSNASGAGSTGAKPNSVPAASHLSLLGVKITVRHGGQARMMLECVGSANCTGKLVLTARQPKRGRRAAHTVTIGSASVIIAAGSTTIIAVKLNGAGRSLLSKAHGRLAGKFTILVRGRSPQSYAVHLSQTR